jgi:hypothetical protein
MIYSSRRQLRAYVLPELSGIIDGTMLNPPDASKANVPGVGMAIKNSGQTPAYNVVSWAGIAVTQPAQENTALVPPPLVGQFANTLGAGSFFSKTLWFNRALTNQEITDVANGVQAVYFYGRIEYRDVFRKHRFANFRLRYNGQFPPPQAAYFNFSESGNDAN